MSSPRTLRYEVRIFNDNVPIVKIDTAPAALFVSHPPEQEGKRFLSDLVGKYDGEIRRMKARTCWNCDKPAVSLTHTPASFLHLPDPHVVDFVQPVCQTGGACDNEARQMMLEEMTMAMSRGR